MESGFFVPYRFVQFSEYHLFFHVAQLEAQEIWTIFCQEKDYGEALSENHILTYSVKKLKLSLK